LNNGINGAVLGKTIKLGHVICLLKQFGCPAILLACALFLSLCWFYAGKEEKMMETKFQELAELLQQQNERLSVDEARTWVEILWEDFEATRAKAGRKYEGQEMTESIVRQWIQHYGQRLDEFLERNPKYHHLFIQRKQ
jgi:hypothetical protein